MMLCRAPRTPALLFVIPLDNRTHSPPPPPARRPLIALEQGDDSLIINFTKIKVGPCQQSPFAVTQMQSVALPCGKGQLEKRKGLACFQPWQTFIFWPQLIFGRFCLEETECLSLLARNCWPPAPLTGGSVLVPGNTGLESWEGP